MGSLLISIFPKMMSNFSKRYFRPSFLCVLTGLQYPESGWSPHLVCRRQGKASRAHHMARGSECLHVMCVGVSQYFPNDTYNLILLHSSVEVCFIHVHFANNTMFLYGFVNVMKGVGGKMATYGFKAVSFSPSLLLFFLCFLLQMKRILEDLAKEI